MKVHHHCNLESTGYWDCFCCHVRWGCIESKADMKAVWFWRIVFLIIAIAAGCGAVFIP